MRQQSKIELIANWMVFKHKLAEGVVGMLMLCALISFIYLFVTDEAKDLMILSWKLELYLSLFAIVLFLFKRFVFDRLTGKRNHE